MRNEIKIGLALGSGGARGVSHTGVLVALEEAGFTPDLIVGTSIGAVAGACYAEDPDAERCFQKIMSFTKDKDFLSTWEPFIPDNNGDNVFQELYGAATKKMAAFKTMIKPALTNADTLKRPLGILLRSRDFSELKIQFAAVSIDLISGAKQVTTEGPLLDAVYGSSAIPGVFPPLEKDGKLLIDGGAPYRVPVEICKQMGADIVIAVNIPSYTPEKTEYGSGIDIILRSDAIARDKLNEMIVETADVVITPAVSRYHWADFRNAELCYEEGKYATEQAIPQLLDVIKKRCSRSYKLRTWLQRKLS